MPVLSDRDIYVIARAAGFSPDQATTFTAIALAESGGNTDAFNGSGESSHGLWQINVASGVRANAFGDLSDPLTNARAAYEISNHGTDVSPWTTTHANNEGTNRDYRTYEQRAEAASHGEGHGWWDGVSGYGVHAGPAGTGSDDVTQADITAAEADAHSHGSAATAFVPSTGAASTATTPLNASTAKIQLLDEHGNVEAYVDAQGNQVPAGAGAGGATTLADANSTDPSSTGPHSWGVLNGATATTGADPAAAGGTSSSDELVRHFLQVAESTRGDAYVFGATAVGPHPTAFDCSELTKWAAEQVGAPIPDGAAGQYRYLEQHHSTMSVEQALHTPGALLFHFESQPDPNGSGEPSVAHVAISLGDGIHTFEARNSSAGVGEFTATGMGFNFAGMIPQMAGATISPNVDALAGYDKIDAGSHLWQIDSDHDGLSDGFELYIGTDPHNADTDHDGLSDGYEVMHHLNPLSADTNHDGIPDNVEVAEGHDAGHYNPVVMSGNVMQRADHGIIDSDHDGVADVTEVHLGMDPHSIDTDHDGIPDNVELELHLNPTEVDSNFDGVSDHLEMDSNANPFEIATEDHDVGQTADHSDYLTH
jgi:hypothetical protein